MIRGRLRSLLRLEWERRLAVVNHHAVARQVHKESEITAGYFLLLTLANLIALSGLLMNSVPVIIGAMLISPLMGPILSYGFGFITGDTAMLRQSVRKIGFSVALTIAVAAVASYASPLQIATPEILSRTKPNLFDLIVAIFAGTAGAGALCTKRSVLTIIPGVAIATAVIPPLSVAGYGLGTAQWSIFWGGFFLFFTNFVAITITTCAVFLSFGFKPGEGIGLTPKAIRNRMLALMAVLLVVSVPLVMTLKASIAELRDRRIIRIALQDAFNQERHSNIASFSQRVLDDGTMAVSAVLNTTEYRSQKEVTETEEKLAKALNRPTTLYLEQIKTLPGGVVPVAIPPVRPRSPGETLSDARNDVLSTLDAAIAELSGLMAPSKITNASMTLSKGDSPFEVNLQIQRDIPLDPEEQHWIEKFLSKELQQPVSVNIVLSPLLAPLMFADGEKGLTPEHEAALRAAGKLFAQGAGDFLQVESVPESHAPARWARLRLEAAKRYLVAQCSIPPDKLKGGVARKAASTPSLVLTFMKAPASSRQPGNAGAR